MKKKIEVVCHKGANKLAPENTYAAAQICLDWGADYVEIDVHTSSDGVLYLFHGPYLEKTTDGSGWIGAYTSTELDRLDAGSWFHPRFTGERIPRLADFLAWIRGKARVYLDIKNADPGQVSGLIHAAGLERDCLLWSQDRAWMEELRRIAPDLPLKVNVKSVADAGRAKIEFDARVVEVGPGGLNLDLVAACHGWDERVMVVYEEDDPDVFRRIIAGGADLINTDYGDLCLKILKDTE